MLICVCELQFNKEEDVCLNCSEDLSSDNEIWMLLCKEVKLIVEMSDIFQRMSE